ncbi:IDEAL domain-containing protein [Virgibacillus natechei]|uniref:IDEAL domain-containing protein n=1 Tax=Virgibacillus sp. CBA3643 TaxID=2942278 RepID=UPI0035A39B2D
MVTVNMFKPYYIKAEDNHVRVILAYQYFSVLINQKVYQFIPVEEKEIRINRRTRKVENVEAKFAFQKGKEVVYMTVSELILLQDFVDQLHSIAEPYYINENTVDQINESAIIIRELENENMKRLIDKALDDRDEEAFNNLVKYL